MCRPGTPPPSEPGDDEEDDDGMGGGGGVHVTHVHGAFSVSQRAIDCSTSNQILLMKHLWTTVSIATGHVFLEPACLHSKNVIVTTVCACGSDFPMKRVL